MLSLEPLVDNTNVTLEETYKKLIPECEEIRVATGYFYLSGFNLHKSDLQNLRNPEEMDRAPFRILMGRKTNRQTVDEIEEGRSLREQVKRSLEADIADLNNAQLDRLERLRDFIANGYVDVRIRAPEAGYFHAKGAAFRAATDSPSDRSGDTDTRAGATIVGSSNFSYSGQRNNVELNLTSQDRGQIEAFETWYDNQWANADPFSEELVEVIETSDAYQQWQTQQESDNDEEHPLGTYLEPFELYKLLVYDALGGNVTSRDSPLFYFQSLGYESAKEKLAKYDGCLISDSVGLGKSFIGGELLYDYRDRGDRCLLIVPANLVDQWTTLLEADTDADGNPYFGLDVDGSHLSVMSISKFQNLTYEEVTSYREQFDVVLLDEAHRFRNHGKWRPDPDSDDDYKGTRRHANLRQLRGLTMIMLTATPINNSATDLKNLLSLFTGENELRNKAGLDFGAFDEYIDLAAERKQAVKGAHEITDQRRVELTNQLQRKSKEISEILNEVMVLRTRKHVKDQIQETEDFEMSFEPPIVHKQEYSLPPAYQPIYRMLPDVMDALHLPHITIRNPQAGGTLKALYKLNLLKRLESSTYAFVQSVETLHESERTLLEVLESLPADTDIQALGTLEADGTKSTTLESFVDGADAATELEQTLEEFGFDPGAVDTDDDPEFVDATVGEVIQYIREDLTLLAYFFTQFISDVAREPGEVNDHAVSVRGWLHEQGAGVLPSVSTDETETLLYPDQDLEAVERITREFFESVFSLRAFRDPKIDRLARVLKATDEKMLVFTQYRATAEYVYRTLLTDPDSPLTETNSAVVKGGDENKRSVIQRFAPTASGYQQQLTESEETELQYVVATDTLSEGVNLQDVHTVVNYDLPWNPMRIVQRVGRIDRIGSTAEKHVHNFYPDGDIEAAIKLLERLQVKISDIALIVGKENNILDPNEDEVLERAGIETNKTIGEIEIDEIESSLRRSRAISDYNELDDTSTNPLLRNAGSDEEAAFERYLLKQDITEKFSLDSDDFEFADEFFQTPPSEREVLYTNITDTDGPRPGVFGLAHLWFGEGTDAPLGRTQRAFYYLPFGGDQSAVIEPSIQILGAMPDSTGEPLEGDTEYVRSHREVLHSQLENRLEQIQQGQIQGVFKQGEAYSKEQETIMEYLRYLERQQSGCLDRSIAGTTSIPECATTLLGRLKQVRLKQTDEDRLLRERFREHDEYDKLTAWPLEEFFETLDTFLQQVIGGSFEYQETLKSAEDANAKLICWGVIAR
jgi:superfamily II DNA or RNA helicase